MEKLHHQQIWLQNEQVEITQIQMEKKLLGMAGVLYVHIHAHDGETTVDYAPSKTKLTEIVKAFEEEGLTDEILNEQLEINKRRHELNIHDPNEEVNDKFVQ